MAWWQKMIAPGMAWATRVMAERACQTFDAQAQAPAETNRAFLLRVLRENQHTVFGKRYHFESIQDEAEYRRRLPLSTYDDYEAEVERIAAGEASVLTVEPVIHLGLSSGTTGRQKRIPITRSAQRHMARSMMFLTQGLLMRQVPAARKGGRGVMLMNATTSGRTAGGISTGAGTSSGMRSMLRMAPLLWTSPTEVYSVSHQPESGFLHLLFALREPDLAFLTAPFSSALVEMLNLLERRGDQLVLTLRTGKLPQTLNLPDETRRALEAQLPPDPVTADRVAAALARGMAGIGLRLWPQLQYIGTVTGGSFQVYGERLKYMVGNVPIHSSVYGATEAMIGVAPAVETTAYAIAPDSAFFEFIPLEQVDDPAPQTLLLHELEVGQAYELVITNPSGLYRYRLGDVVQVTGHYFKTPLVAFQYRRGQLLNLAGEKTLEQAVVQGLLKATQTVGVPLLDFSTRPDIGVSPGRYRIYLELPEGVTVQTLEALTQAIDEALGVSNPRYREARNDGRLSPPRLDAVAPGTFQAVRTFLVSRGASQTQVKVSRLLTNPEVLALVEARRQPVSLEG